MKLKKHSAIIMFFALGSVAGFAICRLIASSKGYPYDYLAKRIQVDNPNKIKINFTTLRKELEDYAYNLGDISSKVSIYYEYLPTGVTININEKNEAVAASLMKLPAVMNLYKASELGRIDLDSRVTLRKEWLNDEYGDLYKKGEGYDLSIREAAALTLKNSDNTALLAIWESMKNSNLDNNDQALNYLDVSYGVQGDQSVLIGARSYSSMLKCLYFACFNSKENSNEMLKYLSESSFKNRLARYIPDDVTISHKIGTYSQKFQSDCGIFYVPKENYILCIMVEGKDPEASNIIADISQKVYLFSKSILINK